MASNNPISKAEEQLRKAKKVHKTLKEELDYLETVEHELKLDSDQEEAQKIRNQLK